MTEINVEIIVAMVTFLVTLLSFFLAIRDEIRRNMLRYSEDIINDEKRHFSHEKRFVLIEDRLNYTDNYISYKLDGITSALGELKAHFSEHLKEQH